ncbi:MAG: NADH-quinone oxidoreductase subunit NuoE [Alphaproteobacteria bacterium]|nr:NADH-quinone oxidoreductase subunit NuoE [Alphaproteobacteria bacterium]
MLRRLHHEQPESFAFSPANLKWTETQIAKYPEGRQASAVIAILWRAQEQEGWLSKPALEAVADLLGMDYIRVLEVATFYFMFQLQPVGALAHVQVCGTTTCMICGSEDLIGICREVIADAAHEISADGNFSWEEVECLGACTNAPMVQIGKDFYENLTADKFRQILTAFARGEVPVPGPQNGRYAAEPLSGLTSLKEFESGRDAHNASVALAVGFGDTIKRIQGDEVPILKPVKARKAKASGNKTAGGAAQKPAMLTAANNGAGDDLKQIEGVGPALEKQLNELGIWHFAQIANWSAAEVLWIDENLKRFKGRASRDNWVEQAKILVNSGDSEVVNEMGAKDV